MDPAPATLTLVETLLATIGGASVVVGALAAFLGKIVLTRIQVRERGETQRRLDGLRDESAARLRTLENDLKKEFRTFEQALVREATVSEFRNPLMVAAYDLQSRLFNVLRKDFIDTFLVHGDEHERAYAVNNTAFVIMQFFCWRELVRRHIQFIDMESAEKTRELARRLDSIYSTFQTDKRDFGRAFRVFAGEQRALGEFMIEDAQDRPGCIGYHAFLRRLATTDDRLVGHLMDDVQGLATAGRDAEARLRALHHELIDLLDFLDPEHVRFAAESRTLA